MDERLKFALQPTFDFSGSIWANAEVEVGVILQGSLKCRSVLRNNKRSGQFKCHASRKSEHQMVLSKEVNQGDLYNDKTGTHLF